MIVCTCGDVLCSDHAAHGFGRQADALWMRGERAVSDGWDRVVALCADCACNEQYDGRLPDTDYVCEIPFNEQPGPCPAGGITLPPPRHEEAR